MAFITVEDRLGEISVIVFAKQYSRFGAMLTADSAVVVSGKISVEEGGSPEILLSAVTPLSSNSGKGALDEYCEQVSAPKKIYLKLPRLDERALSPVYRMAALYSGKDEVIVYDASVGKYSSMKNVRINCSERVISKLKELFGENNVVVK